MKKRNGYVLVYAKDHHRAEPSGVVYEHIIVAEQKLGRKLKKEEVVHHKDLNRSNNNPDNLIVFATNSDHTAFHNGAEIYEADGVWHAIKKKRTKICPICNKEFEVPNSDNLNKRIYCSHRCAYEANSKTKLQISDIEFLQYLLYESNGNFTQVGKFLNVTSNAIVKRLKARNKPYHSKDYKNKINITYR